MKRLLFAFIVTVSLSGCGVENINNYEPIMYTEVPQDVYGTSAKLGGGVVSDGGKTVTEYGFVFSTNENPTTADNKVEIGQGVQTFQDYYNVFESAHTYYYRTYGINETGTGYGETYSFTTNAQAPCNPEIDNMLDTGQYEMNIDLVDTTHPQDGSIQFQTTTYNRNTIIYLEFNEENNRLPQTGQYEVVTDLRYTEPSDNKVKILLRGYIGWELASAAAVEGSSLYVVNNNGELTFIFCEMSMTSYYTLNGKFTYQP